MQISDGEAKGSINQTSHILKCGVLFARPHLAAPDVVS